jgi:hypothetical protein
MEAATVGRTPMVGALALPLQRLDGVTSAIDLVLHIVERERGQSAATVGARRIEYPITGRNGGRGRLSP